MEISMPKETLIKAVGHLETYSKCIIIYIVNTIRTSI